MKHLTSDWGWWGVLALLIAANSLVWVAVLIVLYEVANPVTEWTGQAFIFSAMVSQFVAFPAAGLGFYSAIWNAKVGQKRRSKILSWLSGSAITSGILAWIIAQGVQKAMRS